MDAFRSPTQLYSSYYIFIVRLRPDTKTQVTVKYRNEHGAFIPLEVDTVVVSTQHSPDISLADLQKAIKEHVILPVIPAKYLTDRTIYHIQPSGKFIIGGPQGDAGLTGRKIIVDTVSNVHIQHVCIFCWN